MARVAWRVGHTPLPLPASIAPWQQRAAHGLHLVLYVLLFAVPLSGWLMSSAKGLQTVYLGLLPLPDLIGHDKALGQTLENCHAVLNYTLLALVLGHIGVALKHHYFDHDDVLARMLPFLDKEARK
jgi:cytochrome b561